jgi:hypothetical protein
VFALVFAVRGVRTWNQERRDLRRAELAEKTLTIAHRAKDAIGVVRSPFGYAGEGSTRKREPNESDREAEALDRAFAPIERLNTIGDVFDEIQSLRYSLTAAFGRQVPEPLLVFLRVRNEIAGAARINMREALDAVRGRDAAMDRNAVGRAERREAIIWEGLNDPDAIVARLDAAIADLERTFRPYVEATFRPLSWSWPRNRQDARVWVYRVAHFLFVLCGGFLAVALVAVTIPRGGNVELD